jgi:hypothetical protein
MKFHIYLPTIGMCLLNAFDTYTEAEAFAEHCLGFKYLIV